MKTFGKGLNNYMTIQIRKAERKKAKLRIGLSAPSGAGKTYSALLLAKGLVGSWNKIGLIDTENGRGDLYSDLGEYNIYTLVAPFSPERYIEVIKAMEMEGMEAIIIDSISHEWEGAGGCLEINESLAIARYKGNSWSAWNETTPRHRRFIETIIASPAHIITTVRNKVETVMTEDKKVKKVGVKDITREGHDYEMTINFNIDQGTHLVTASKDNTHLFDGKDPFIITEETGRKLLEWSNSGASADPKNDLITGEQIENLRSIVKQLDADMDEVNLYILKTKKVGIDGLSQKQAEEVISAFDAKLKKKQEEAKTVEEAAKEFNGEIIEEPKKKKYANPELQKAYDKFKEPAKT